MFIFSSHRGPWVTALFLVVISVASLVKCQSDAEKEAAQEAADRSTFPAFEEAFNKAVDASTPIVTSEQLFPFYRCGIRSITERNYCNRKTDAVLNQLNQTQREAVLPLLKETFKPKF